MGTCCNEVKHKGHVDSMVDPLAESWGSVGKGISGEAKKPLEVEASNVVLGTELCAPPNSYVEALLAHCDLKMSLLWR